MFGKLLVSFLSIVALAVGAEAGVWFTSNPEAEQIPSDPNAPLCVEVPVANPDAGPFGTVVQQWNLAMSKTYAGSGITWVRSLGRFFLMDQGRKVWSFEPQDPVGTIRDENWVFPNLGSSTPDVTWGIAWDDDSSCFWITQVVDGNTYGGCYLLRLSPQGAWYGTPRDSWRIGDGSGGGGLQMYWGAGMEKWIDRGFFCIAPVAPSPSVNNYVCKFDPYTKTNLGRVQYGDLVSERGCALIPYDSLYILTCGWNADAYRKRREDGYLLQQVSTPSAPADWAMWVPRNIVPTDSVYVFCMTSSYYNTLQKISCGFTWGQLPSVEYQNLAVTEILAPAREVDSGATVVPKVVVANRGPKTADSFDVFIRIGSDYDSRRVVKYLPGGRNAIISFDPWVAQTRESLDVTAFVWWEPDQTPGDDTLSSRILARVKNVAVTEIIAPTDTLDSAAVVIPLCRVQNRGNLPETFEVKFKIGLYENTVTVTGLDPGSFRLVQAGEPYQAKSGTWLHRLEAILEGDLLPDNNTMLDTFWVRGTPTTDVAAEAILSPAGRIRPGIRVRPSARVANYGGKRENFSVFFSVWDTVTDRLVYHREVGVSLGAGGAVTTVNFPETSFAVSGTHISRCSVYAAGDGNMTNDVVWGQFRIDPTVYQHNVMVQAITAPVGSMDSASTVVPTVLVTNTGLSSETFTAHFVGPGYSATLDVYDLPAESTRTLRFPVWHVASPRGSQIVKAWTYLIGDQYRADDTSTIQVNVRVRDVGAVSIVHPVDTVPDGITLRPRCMVQNFGTNSVNFDVEFRIGVWVDTATVSLLEPGQSTVVEMKKLYSTNPGMWLSTARTLLADDKVPANNVCYDTFWVPGVIRHDVAVEQVLAPADTVDTLTNVVPKARVANYSPTTETWRVFFKVYDTQGGVVYSESLLGVSLPSQTSKVLEFPQTRFPVAGTYVGRCSSHLVTDQNWTNNVAAREFYVVTAGGWEKGMKEVSSVPLGSGRQVKDGGFIVADLAGRIFVGKGYKTGEFYLYSAGANRWTPLCSIPWYNMTDTKAKLPGKGAAAVCDGLNKIYLVMGNNTLGFLEYDISANSWKFLQDVPLGNRGSRVKGGTAAEYVGKGDTGYVYVIKGGTNEFYRYNIQAKRWDTMPPAPYSTSPKYPAGSWLRQVPSGVTPLWYMYVHQAKYNSEGRHSLFSYDLLADTWTRVSLRGMPLAGMQGGSFRAKKSGDGGGAVVYAGNIYAIKGGNTQGFYRYSPGMDDWTELDTIPRSGSGGKKCVKGGGGITVHPAGAFFILKGNKTSELWRYVERTVSTQIPVCQEGMQTDKLAVPCAPKLQISPNPLARGFVTARISAQGRMSSRGLRLRLFDAGGRCFLSRQLDKGESAVTLDLRGIPGGVYLARLDHDRGTLVQKLVVQK